MTSSTLTAAAIITLDLHFNRTGAKINNDICDHQYKQVAASHYIQASSLFGLFSLESLGVWMLTIRLQMFLMHLKVHQVDSVSLDDSCCSHDDDSESHQKPRSASAPWRRPLHHLHRSEESERT